MRQAKIIVKEMAKAVKEYVGDYLFAGKYGDPEPKLLAACKHVKPNNDAQERAFGIVDFRIKKHPHETTEMTDARTKLTLNDPLPVLEKQGPDRANEGWRASRLLLRKRKRDEKERRKEYRQAKIARMEEKEQKEDQKQEKKQKAEAEFNAVEVARTPDQLDKLLRHENKLLPVSMQKSVLRAQIRQLTGVHGVSKFTLPLSSNGKRLDADALYANLIALMSCGDPTEPATEAKLREHKRNEKTPKRGRPKSAKPVTRTNDCG